MKHAGKTPLLRAGRLAILLSVVAGVSSAVVAVAGAATQASADQVSCHSSTAHVALAAGQSASYTVAGYFCATLETADGASLVQFLIHGGTYNHDYWDFGTVDGIQYSYARQIASAEIPTFFIDQTAVIALDEQRKDVVSEYMFAGPDLSSTDATQAINVPVLTIVGSQDAVSCDDTYSCAFGKVVAAEEAPYYSAVAKLVACVVPGSGHAIALNRNVGTEVSESVAWTKRYISGQGGAIVPSAGSCAAAG